MLNTAISSCLLKRERKKKDTFQTDFEKLVGINSEKIRPVDSDDILDLIDDHTDPSGKELIKNIRNRNYYKRLVTIHYEVDQRVPYSI